LGGYDRRITIQNAAAHGLYEIRGLVITKHGAPFDDLVFLGTLSRYPLEGYQEKMYYQNHSQYTPLRQKTDWLKFQLRSPV